MRPALLTPMRLLCGIAAFTILCMFAVAVVTDHLANATLFTGDGAPASRIHLVEEITQAIKRAQDCRHSYLATGKREYLEDYRAACSEADVRMDRLVGENNEITAKLAHAADLRDLVREKLAAIGDDLASTAVAKGPEAIPAADADLARIEKLLDSLAQDESREVTGGLETARARSLFHHDMVIAIAAINLLFLIGVAFCAIQIGKLYSLVTMCAWSKRVEYEGKWVPLEEYMRKRFGIRITHGISQEEYDKWALQEVPPDPAQAEQPLDVPLCAAPPKAAA